MVPAKCLGSKAPRTEERNTPEAEMCELGERLHSSHVWRRSAPRHVAATAPPMSWRWHGGAPASCLSQFKAILALGQRVGDC